MNQLPDVSSNQKSVEPLHDDEIMPHVQDFIQLLGRLLARRWIEEQNDGSPQSNEKDCKVGE